MVRSGSEYSSTWAPGPVRKPAAMPRNSLSNLIRKVSPWSSFWAKSTWVISKAWLRMTVTMEKRLTWRLVTTRSPSQASRCNCLNLQNQILNLRKTSTRNPHLQFNNLAPAMSFGKINRVAQRRMRLILQCMITKSLNRATLSDTKSLKACITWKMKACHAQTNHRWKLHQS